MSAVVRPPLALLTTGDTFTAGRACPIMLIAGCLVSSRRSLANPEASIRFLWHKIRKAGDVVKLSSRVKSLASQHACNMVSDSSRKSRDFARNADFNSAIRALDQAVEAPLRLSCSSLGVPVYRFHKLYEFSH
jgi:hypothetical protein